MITHAKALSYRAMQALVAQQPELLATNCFVSILVSATKPHERIFAEDTPRTITLFFDDITTYWEQRLTRSELAQFRRFSERDADRIVEFLLSCQARPEAETLFVNCAAGTSRSGAVVSFAREVFGLDEKQFSQDNPTIRPNDLMLPILRNRWQLRHGAASGPCPECQTAHAEPARCSKCAACLYKHSRQVADPQYPLFACTICEHVNFWD
jgi:predicted protein tyrosine phosphatase